MHRNLITRGIRLLEQQYLKAVEYTEQQDASENRYTPLETLDPKELEGWTARELFFGSEQSDTDSSTDSRTDTALSESDDFDPWALFFSDETIPESDTDPVLDSRTETETDENTGFSEQAFLSALQSDGESGTIVSKEHSETTDASHETQTKQDTQTTATSTESTARSPKERGIMLLEQQFQDALERAEQERLIEQGEERILAGEMPEPDQLAAMGKSEAEALGMMAVLQMTPPNDALEVFGAEDYSDFANEGIVGGYKRYAKHRPDYGKNQIEMVWELWADPETQMVEDPSGAYFAWDRTKPRRGQWDMGHRPGQRYADVHALYMADKMSEVDFLKWYRDPTNYRPELPSTNRSHKYE